MLKLLKYYLLALILFNITFYKLRCIITPRRRYGSLRRQTLALQVAWEYLEYQNNTPDKALFILIYNM